MTVHKQWDVLADSNREAYSRARREARHFLAEHSTLSELKVCVDAAITVRQRHDGFRGATPRAMTHRNARVYIGEHHGHPQYLVGPDGGRRVH